MVKILYGIAFFFLISVEGHALRCGKRLISVGDSKFQVLNRCGDPDYTEIRKRLIGCSGYSGNEPFIDNDYNLQENSQVCNHQQLDVWVYNFGPQKFMRELVFLEGKLIKINDLEYGH